MAEKASLKKRGKAKANGLGHNSHAGGVPATELIQRHFSKIVQLRGQIDRLMRPVKQARSKLSNAYAAAKADGLEVDDVKLTLKIEERNQLDVIASQSNIGLYLRARNHPLAVQLNLFSVGDLPARTNAAMEGRRDGKAGVSIETNPYKPGSEEFEEYRAAWEGGQQETRETLRE